MLQSFYRKRGVPVELGHVRREARHIPEGGVAIVAAVHLPLLVAAHHVQSANVGTQIPFKRTPFSALNL